MNWTAESDTGDMVVFPKFHQVPFSKILTFYRRDNFSVEGEYDGDVPVVNPKIGQFEIGEVKPLADGGNQKVKVKVRVNLHGIFVVSSANYVEKHEVSLGKKSLKYKTNFSNFLEKSAWFCEIDTLFCKTC